MKVIADREQTEKIPTSLIARMASQGVLVFMDSNHSSAHNKVMLIDAGSAQATLITGSFNFTHAAQHKNAENVLVMRGNSALVDLYLENWRDHFSHARPYR
ncbi:phospholipase D-like protein [Nitrosospira multiformis]|uniref:phospholipase D n=1 Tax=Nitrosospira multiformis TaxID=1231 RepID=A0A2T5I7D7_9PROT|nr:phospholipase D-like domain-containing protein [Nitrosospira multiformis]PTQ79737.1 phospholipase D-like protein [Nitrosospira multiformis]